MASSSTTFSLFLLLLLIIPLSTSLPSESISNAVETLANSGYVAMSLTLQITSSAIFTPELPTATIFSPNDAAFSKSGQPSLPLLLYHISPLSLSPQSLKSFPYSAAIPTLSPNKSLTITSSPTDSHISINNIHISDSPIFDDGLVLIFGLDHLFDLNFTLPPPPLIPSPNHQNCVVSKGHRKRGFAGEYSFRGASDVLRSRGYAVMAAFLDLQLLGIVGDRPKLTVFAPSDEVMVAKIGKVPEYSALFLRHVIGCRLSWTELVNLKEGGREIGSYLEGFDLVVRVSDDLLRVNEVEITFPDMFFSDWLVVHGVKQIFKLPEAEEEYYGDGEEPGFVDGEKQGEEVDSVKPEERVEF